LATTVVITTTTQQALADKTGPNYPDEDNVKQGALGEFLSNDGRDYYYDEELNGVGTSGRDQGQAIQNYARAGDQLYGHEYWVLDSLGENFAYYANGTCHARTRPCD
jgi:hypothetical protein